MVNYRRLSANNTFREKTMKICELVKKTGVPKETIHFYIREGLLRKPRKSGVNIADYHAGYVEQIQLIKDLRDNYYLPIPEIKKIIKNFKKQSPSDQAISQFHSKYLRPLDRLLSSSIVGSDAFREATGLGRKWLTNMEKWGIITADYENGEPVYSPDDVIIGRYHHADIIPPDEFHLDAVLGLNPGKTAVIMGFGNQVAGADYLNAAAAGRQPRGQ